MSTPLDPGICTGLVQSALWSKNTMQLNECILWTGRTREGYGQIWLPRHADGTRQRVSVHRVVLVAKLGRDIHEGLQAGHICHDQALSAGLCDSHENSPCHHRRCVNPNHIEEQTPRENTRASNSPSAQCARRAECANGHPLNGVDARDRRRRCDVCEVERSRRRHATIQAAAVALGLTYRQYVATGGTRQAAEELLAALHPMNLGRAPASAPSPKGKLLAGPTEHPQAVAS